MTYLTFFSLLNTCPGKWICQLLLGLCFFVLFSFLCFLFFVFFYLFVVSFIYYLLFRGPF